MRGSGPSASGLMTANITKDTAVAARPSKAANRVDMPKLSLPALRRRGAEPGETGLPGPRVCSSPIYFLLIDFLLRLRILSALLLPELHCNCLRVWRSSWITDGWQK